ncbi:MAG: hypothetical protein LBL24_04920 [Bacteroidales bacterium]|jgi:hypothetical protein|nr:hypothetical protein [Bacteroidales bacterium]
MAKMILQKDSAAMHLRMAKRHTRLCGRLAHTKKYAAAIQQVLEQLKEKEKERENASDDREYAYDDVILCDTDLDNAVRTTFEQTRQYDRDHLSQALELLFPTGRFSDLVQMSLSKEPQEVKNLVVKLNQLEDGHQLKPLAAILQEKADASIAAWDAYQQAINRLKAIQASEELTKLAVRKQYENNWLEARKEFGASLADRIFPKMSSRTSPHKDDEEPPTSEE